MPKSNDKNVADKYPFNATKILSCDNEAIMKKIMNEIHMGEDSDNEEDEKDEKENINDEKKKEKNKEFIEVKEDENKEKEPEIKNEGQPQEKQEIVEAKIEETKGEEEKLKETKSEEPKKEEEKEGHKKGDDKVQKEVTIIYDNVDYLLDFLNESEEKKIKLCFGWIFLQNIKQFNPFTIYKNCSIFIQLSK